MPIHPLWLTMGLVIAFGATGRMFMARRREQRELRELARRHSLNFAPEDLIGLHDRYHNLQLIRSGHSRQAWNVLYGMTRSGPLSLFKYNFELGFGMRRDVKRWWLAVLELETAQPSWTAEPGAEAIPHQPQQERCGQAGPFTLRAEHESTLGSLCAKGIERVLESAPRRSSFRGSGPTGGGSHSSR